MSSVPERLARRDGKSARGAAVHEALNRWGGPSRPEGAPPLSDYLSDEQMTQLAAVLVRLIVATAEQKERRARAAAERSAAEGES
jgi:cytochrome c553